MSAPARPSWQEAVSVACRAHAGQARRDGRTPYAAHPARVALACAALFGCDDEDVLAAAALHDVIEDTGLDREDVADAFGEEVARLVVALSKDPRLPEAEREAAYDRALAGAGWKAALVKLADVYDNMCDIGPGETPAKRARLLDRTRRALAIAEPHGAEHACVARAAERVRALLGSLA